MKGRTQAFHLSKKQLTIPMKIRTQKEKEEFFSGKGSICHRGGSENVQHYSQGQWISEALLIASYNLLIDSYSQLGVTVLAFT